MDEKSRYITNSIKNRSEGQSSRLTIISLPLCIWIILCLGSVRTRKKKRRDREERERERKKALKNIQVLFYMFV